MLNAPMIQRRTSHLFSYQLAGAGDTGCDNRRWRAFTNGFYYLAEISHRQNDDKKALQMLERSLDANKEYAPAKALLAKLKK